MKKFAASLIVLLAACNLNFAQKIIKPSPTPPVRTIIGGITDANTNVAAKKLSPELEKRVESFKLVWKTIRDNYFDQTFNNLDWEKIRQEYEPRVLKTKTDDEFHTLLQEMIKRLNRSHLVIISPDVYREIEKMKTLARLNQKASVEDASDGANQPPSDEPVTFDPTEFARFGIGIDLRLINNQFVVTRVESGSSGEKAGLKTGYVIEKVNDFPLKWFLEKYEKLGASWKRILPFEIVAWLLNGTPDSSVALAYLDEKDELKEAVIKRERLKGDVVSVGKNVPEQFFTSETKSLNTEVGYIRFNLFTLQTVEFFCSALTELKDKKAIIVDLRGNTGGLFGALMGVGGMLSDKTLDLGTQIYKVGSEKLTSTPKIKNFKGRLVFLIDNLSISSAEIFAAAMQENNRALVVGEKSAGEALPALSILLPTGAVFIYPIANFKTPKGNSVEGVGVAPNYTVVLDRKSLLEGKDNQIETALKIIKDDAAFPAQVEKPPVTIKDDEPILIAKPTPKPVPQISGGIGATNEGAKKIETVKPAKDEKAVQTIADFINAVGGEEELNKIESYQLSGYGQFGVKGATVEMDVSIFRRKPDKYAIIYKSPSLGEAREVYTGKGFFRQSDFGISSEVDFPLDSANVEIYAPIFNLLKKDYFESLKYLGEFDREGRKARVVEGKHSFLIITLAFDSETKMLVGYATRSSTVFLGDYRAVGNIKLPFSVIQDFQTTYLIMDAKLNEKIDESVFNKKENCFDRPN
jgi:carboxyl-terminal processing protease